MINIQSDSRKIKKGDTFIALRGFSSDGHDYIPIAIEKGASKIICEEGNYEVETLVVPDTRKYLEEYLKENYNKYLKEMKIIGVTGTNGKTTTAKLIHDALNKAGVKTAYIGTIGYYMGEKVRNLANTTPDLCDLYDIFMESYDKGAKVIVMEVSSQGIDMGRVKTIDFDYAIFTNLTEDHLDYHKTMENYALAKRKLFEKSKVNFINVDDKYKDYFILDDKKTITYGKSESDYQIKQCVLTSFDSKFTYVHDNTSYNINTKLIGEYNIYNMMGVIFVLDMLNIDNKEEIISSLSSPVGRMEKVLYKNNTIIIDYAHTPDAIEKLINNVKPYTLGKTYVIFGCTGSREREKRPIMSDIVNKNSDYFIITMDDLHDESFESIVKDMTKDLISDHYEVIEDRKKAIEKGISLLKNNDTLYILGKGHEEAIIIGKSKIEFNDKEIVKSIVKNL